jgi:GTPase
VNDSFVVLRPEPEGVWVDKIGDREFRVNGRSAERIVAISDITSADALAYIDHRMEKLGVGKALSKAGARAGDVIWIGGFSFEYEP